LNSAARKEQGDAAIAASPCSQSRLYSRSELFIPLSRIAVLRLLMPLLACVTVLARLVASGLLLLLLVASALFLVLCALVVL
jgi:hypothetical protein